MNRPRSIRLSTIPTSSPVSRQQARSNRSRRIFKRRITLDWAKRRQSRSTRLQSACISINLVFPITPDLPSSQFSGGLPATDFLGAPPNLEYRVTDRVVLFVFGAKSAYGGASIRTFGPKDTQSRGPVVG